MEKSKEQIKAEKEAEEHKRQVDQYHTLGITASARGQVVLVFSGLLLLSVVLSLFGIYATLGDILISLIFYIPILFFVYKGHRWAMVVLMILWVIEKGYTAYLAIENGGSVVGSIIWLGIGLSIIYKALKVENDRIKTTPVVLHEESIFCTKCGTKQELGTKFCANCGNLLTN